MTLRLKCITWHSKHFETHTLNVFTEKINALILKYFLLNTNFSFLFNNTINLDTFFRSLMSEMELLNSGEVS